MKRPVLGVLICLVTTLASAADLLVEKRAFSIDGFQTFNGNTIEKVKVGWESYGSLNEDKSNVILITHFFSGSSHAAGKYSPDDPLPGYWDAIIGPGKAIDTEKYFVISSDTLVNAGFHDPRVITTGPASINPATGSPYGLEFPVVTIRDFVNVQKALLESLGISRLHAVVGPSMGAIQAIEWAAAYPDWVERMVSVIGMVHSDAWTTLALEQWSLPIRLDPLWNQGNYYGSAPPLEGLTNSLMLITLQALYPDFINQVQAEHSPTEQAPLNDINASHAVVDWLRAAAAQRAAVTDANHVLYLVRACQLFLAGHGDSLERGLANVRAKSLFLPAATDLLLMPYMAKLGHDTLARLGRSTQYAEIQGIQGHLDGVYGIQRQADRLRTFLEE